MDAGRGQSLGHGSRCAAGPGGNRRGVGGQSPIRQRTELRSDIDQTLSRDLGHDAGTRPGVEGAG